MRCAKPRFSKDWTTNYTTSWLRCFGHLSGKPDIKILEIGVFEGRTSVWMLENILTDSTSRLVAIDPFNDYPFMVEPPGGMEDYRSIFLENIESYKERVILHEGKSQDILRKMVYNTFDVIYIDGSHIASDVLFDAVLSWPLLKKSGYLVFDDYQLKYGATYGCLDEPKIAIDAFLAIMARELTVLHETWQVIVEKK